MQSIKQLLESKGWSFKTMEFTGNAADYSYGDHVICTLQHTKKHPGLCLCGMWTTMLYGRTGLPRSLVTVKMNKHETFQQMLFQMAMIIENHKS